MLKSFLSDETGASAAEYAIILALVGASIAVAAFAFGDRIASAISGPAAASHECSPGDQSCSS